MITEQIARIIASFFVFLELSGDEIVDPDEAVQMEEWLCGCLQELDKPFLRGLVDAFPVVALEYSGEAQELVRKIPYSFYLEEALAEGDPVRLAELEALRDAEES